MISRQADPPNLETPLDQLTTWITPSDQFFVRTHHDIPRVNPYEWRLYIEGAIAHPLTLTLDELKAFPGVSQVVTLECAGNGRAFYRPKVIGVPWEKGAVSTARWTGVRLVDLLRRAGVKEHGQHVICAGADVEGQKPKFIRSFPIEKALEPATLLVYEMNGLPLPVSHGYPLRLVVPGWTGNHSVKWLNSISVSSEPYDGASMDEYRFPTTYVSPGTSVKPEHMEMITGLPVKSLITYPQETMQLHPGLIPIRGAAYGGQGGIARVEVSTDLGRQWSSAELGNDIAPHAWRLWQYQWYAKQVGAYMLMVRAYDSVGQTQPLEPFWNPEGALWNVIDRIRVSVS